MATGYDFTIDCAMDFIPDLDLERKATGTGELEAYAGVTDFTLLISATRGSSTPINASLSKTATERTDYPGRYFATFDVADLQTHLLSDYEGQVVFLNLYKSGELQYEPFRCLVTGDRLGV